MKSIILLTCLFTFNNISFANVADEKIFSKKIIVMTYDKITSTQKTKDIVTAKIERDTKIPYRPDVKDVNVDFFYKGSKLGQDKTDRQGLASVTIDPTIFELGLNIIDVKGPNGSRGNLKLYVVDELRPIFITDIDHTISDLSSWRVPITSPENTPTLPGAAKAINQLSNDYFIFYLTARDDAFMDKTLKWLDIKGFVDGPVAFGNLKLNNRDSFDQGIYKQKVIKELQQDFRQILIGAGDKPHDVEAYRKYGLRAYFIGPTCPSDLAKGTICAKSWKQILSHLETFPIGTLNTDPDVY